VSAVLRPATAPPAAVEAEPIGGHEVEPPVAVAGQWRLMWRKFRRHRLAVAGGIVVILIVLTGLLADFLAPADPHAYSPRHAFAPPQALKLGSRDGGWGLYVEGLRMRLDPVAMRREFVPDPAVRIPVVLLVETAPYRLLGLIPLRHRLIGPRDAGAPIYLLGADRLGRDVLSRIVHGTRVSMSIGLLGVALSLFLGVLLGGLSGFYGGTVDTLIQRLIEFLQALPAIPLWMGLAAAIPPTWHPLRVYFIITVIISIIGWTGLARVVRGRFLSLRTEDFIAAAKLDGVSDLRIILRHMVPSFASHIIAAVTLAIPGMILAETALSFLGIGLRPPVVSWGVLLQEAQNIRNVALAPWLFWPGAAVIVTVLSLNFLGDGLRDAADPYA
jgi:peptide/nickel transport system permease protein